MQVEYLYRAHGTKDGVFGVMGPWTTVEEEDLNNAPNISCIPVGAYVCKRTWYNKGGYESFEITNVEGRSNILFHVLNTEEGTEGCVGVASHLGVMRVRDEDSHEMTYKLAGRSSRNAFNAFMRKWEGVDEFLLVVRWVGGNP